MNYDGYQEKNNKSSVSIPVSESSHQIRLYFKADLTIPKNAKGIVLFAHGSRKRADIVQGITTLQSL